MSKNNTKYTWSAEIKSVPDFKCISPKQINLMISSKNNGFGQPICVQIPRVKQPIPLFIVFRALGVISDKEACEYILLNLESERHQVMLNNLQASIIEANKYMTKEEIARAPTSPEHLAVSIACDDDWYTPRAPRIKERFDQWMAT